MYSGQYISIYNIIERVYRDTDFQDSLSFADAVEWAGEAISKIDCPSVLIEKVTSGKNDMPGPIKIVNGKGELPCDFYQERLVRVKDSSTTIKQATNNFFKSGKENSRNEYIIQGDYIYFDNDNCDLELSYWAFPTDKDGWPLIPDDETIKNAVSAYIVWKICTKMWLKNNLTNDKYHRIEQEWLFYAAAATNSARNPSVARMQNIANMWLRSIPNVRGASDGFAGLNKPEIRNF
jgi:hypothetical protein